MNNVFSNKITSVIIAVIVCALWGSLFPFVKIGYSAFQIASNDIPTIMLFAGSRFVISGILLFIIFSAKEKKISIPPKNILKFVLLCSFAGFADEYAKHFNENIGLIPCADGLTHRGDDIYFDSKSYRILGKRYFEAYLKTIGVVK